MSGQRVHDGQGARTARLGAGVLLGRLFFENTRRKVFCDETFSGHRGDGVLYGCHGDGVLSCPEELVSEKA